MLPSSFGTPGLLVFVCNLTHMCAHTQPPGTPFPPTASLLLRRQPLGSLWWWTVWHDLSSSRTRGQHDSVSTNALAYFTTFHSLILGAQLNELKSTKCFGTTLYGEVSWEALRVGQRLGSGPSPTSTRAATLSSVYIVRFHLHICWGKMFCCLTRGLKITGLTIVCSARLEAFSDHSGKLQLPLQEIIDWLSQKDEELSAQLPLQGDVVLVQQEKETHAVG